MAVVLGPVSVLGVLYCFGFGIYGDRYLCGECGSVVIVYCLCPDSECEGAICINVSIKLNLNCHLCTVNTLDIVPSECCAGNA